MNDISKAITTGSNFEEHIVRHTKGNELQCVAMCHGPHDDGNRCQTYVSCAY